MELKSGRKIVVKFGGSSLADHERLSKAVASVVNEAKRGTKIAVVVSAMGKTTDVLFSNANPLREECKTRIKENVLPIVEKSTVPVIAGFVGRTVDGKITTLGRGGSGTTAFILADAL